MPSRILRINVQLEAMKKILITRSLGSLVDVSTFLISSESNEINEKKKEKKNPTRFHNHLPWGP
jgi:hypothetical protein